MMDMSEYLVWYVITLMMMSQCVIAMTMMESYMHVIGKSCDTIRRMQWRLINCTFVKSKRKNRYGGRIKTRYFRLKSNRMKSFLMIMAAGYKVMAMSSMVGKVNKVHGNSKSCDTDSFPIKIDNCCTQSMSGYKDDFIESTFKRISGMHVVGFGQTRSTITHSGTVQWSIYDDNGMLHTFYIPNVFYIPGCGVRLLSPQHWAQETKDISPKPDGTWCATFHDRVELRWSQQKYIKTIHISPKDNNIATMWSAGNSKRYSTFDKMAKKVPITCDSEVTKDDVPVEDLYDKQLEWDKFEKVSHEGDGMLKISGYEHEAAKTSATEELLE
jgi:hypothetical protein